MDQLNSVFKDLKGFQPPHRSLISTSLCVWVWNADKAPPHVGISSQGNYFSLKVKGKDALLSVSVLFDTIERKKIPTLCFILSDSSRDISPVFSRYSFAEAGKITCLFPIREILGLPDARQLSDLLAALEIQERIRHSIGFHLPENYQGIPSYGLQDIHDRLEKLAHG